MKVLPALLLSFFSLAAFADTPMPPPELQTTCSASKVICAVSDPATNATVVSSRVPTPRSWTIPGWHRWVFPSDDGVSVVVAYGGMNLVPRNVELTEPVLFFYNEQQLVRTVRLGDLYRRKGKLQRTVSHYAWVSTITINPSNQLVIERVDGAKIAFSLPSGDKEPLRPDGATRHRN
ncbi:MAG: hypothetical protein ACREPC_04960 [Stenotrophomonas sp.]|uniref:hypothetical protein n=1 Tax=Stenotrophomonas sp. TaxID=69392 RepID=UPI003D6D1410